MNNIIGISFEIKFVGKFDKESSNLGRNKSFCSDQKYKTQKTESKQHESSKVQILTDFNECTKKLAHDNSQIHIICAFSYTDTASTTRCVSYNSEVFELFVSIEEHF